MCKIIRFGLPIYKWEECSDKIRVILEEDPNFKNLEESDKEYCVSVSAGWPIEHGESTKIDISEDGLNRIVEGAKIVASSKVYCILPQTIKDKMNALYGISNGMEGKE